jgi:rubrerythrin
MQRFQSVDEILDFAIKEEQEAADFYMELAGKMDKSWMQKLFEDFSAEERGHMQKLLSVKMGERLLPAAEKVMNLKIADYLVDIEPSEEMGYQDALILAMKKEKAAFKLYTDLAAATNEEDIKQSLLALAQDEARHKLRFEIEYDNLLQEG